MLLGSDRGSSDCALSTAGEGGVVHLPGSGDRPIIQYVMELHTSASRMAWGIFNICIRWPPQWVRVFLHFDKSVEDPQSCVHCLSLVHRALWCTPAYEQVYVARKEVERKERRLKGRKGAGGSAPSWADGTGMP